MHSARAKAPFQPITAPPSPTRMLDERVCSSTRGAPYRRRSATDRQVRAVCALRRHSVPRAVRRHVDGYAAKMLRLFCKEACVRVGFRQRDGPRIDVRRSRPPPRPGGVFGAGKYRPDCITGWVWFTIDLPPLRQRGTTSDLGHHYVRGATASWLGVREVTAEAIGSTLPLPLAGQHPRAAERAEQGVAASTGSVLIPRSCPCPIAAPARAAAARPSAETRRLSSPSSGNGSNLASLSSMRKKQLRRVEQVLRPLAS